MNWRKNGLRRKILEFWFSLGACTRSTGPQLGRPGHWKWWKSSPNYLFHEILQIVYPIDHTMYPVYWIHTFLQGELRPEVSQTGQNPVYPVDIQVIMSTGYTANPVEPPNCLAPGPSGPGQHHGHDVDRGHCRMSTWGSTSSAPGRHPRGWCRPSKLWTVSFHISVPFVVWSIVGSIDHPNRLSSSVPNTNHWRGLALTRGVTNWGSGI